MNYCPNCRQALDYESVFCSRCGQQVAEFVGAPVRTPARTKSGKGLRYLIIFIAISVTITIALYASGFFKSDEDLIRERIESFESDYNSGDFEAVLENFDARTRNALSAVFNMVGFSADIGNLGFSADYGDLFAIGTATAMGNGLHFEIVSIEIVGDKATAHVILHDNTQASGGSEPGTFELVKEDNDWFIRDGGS